MVPTGKSVVSTGESTPPGAKSSASRQHRTVASAVLPTFDPPIGVADDGEAANCFMSGLLTNRACQFAPIRITDYFNRKSHGFSSILYFAHLLHLFLLDNLEYAWFTIGRGSSLKTEDRIVPNSAVSIPKRNYKSFSFSYRFANSITVFSPSHTENFSQFAISSHTFFNFAKYVTTDVPFYLQFMIAAFNS